MTLVVRRAGVLTALTVVACGGQGGDEAPARVDGREVVFDLPSDGVSFVASCEEGGSTGVLADGQAVGSITLTVPEEPGACAEQCDAMLGGLELSSVDPPDAEVDPATPILHVTSVDPVVGVFGPRGPSDGAQQRGFMEVFTTQLEGHLLVDGRRREFRAQQATPSGIRVDLTQRTLETSFYYHAGSFGGCDAVDLFVSIDTAGGA